MALDQLTGDPDVGEPRKESLKGAPICSAVPHLETQRGAAPWGRKRRRGVKKQTLTPSIYENRDERTVRSV